MSNVLVGACIGDALGVPFETYLPNNPLLVSWDGVSFLGSEHHGLKPCQYSDDGQMSVMVAKSLIGNNGFDGQDLAYWYTDWIMTGVARGYGKTTLMAIENLQKGVHWTKSGIEGSYGNGTAMRAAPFGIYYRDDIKTLVEVVKLDSAITHRSDEAEAGALAIALSAAFLANGDSEDLLKKILPYLPESKVKDGLNNLGYLLLPHLEPQKVLSVIGTKADVRQSVPAAMYCFLKFPHYHEAVLNAIKAGGDTDTTAAIVGALYGAYEGLKGIPHEFYIVEDFDKLLVLDSQLYNRSDELFFRK